MKHLALIGMAGAGKTTVGALVAGELGLRFLDSDVQVEHLTGMSVRDIFRLEGEESFRDAEAKALEASVAETETCVIGVAGGAVLREESRLLLKEKCLVVWLRASVDTLVARVGDGQSRPLLSGDPRQKLTELYKERVGIYSALADSTVDVDIHNADDIAHIIALMYKEVGRHV
jgi:shikimate kinase